MMVQNLLKTELNFAVLLQAENTVVPVSTLALIPNMEEQFTLPQRTKAIATVMSVSHAYFYSFWIIFTFQYSLPAVPDIITQDSERLLYNII